MDRASWLVAFLAASDGGVDPERLQKGLFLLSEASVIPEGERYHFEPYLDGPAASDVWGDLDALIEGGYVTLRAVPGSRWREFRLSLRGQREALAVDGRIGQHAIAAVRSVRQLVDSMRSRELTAWIAGEHPRFRRSRAASF